MKMTLKASLLSSTKKNDIYYGDPLLYIRPKEGSYRFPELYTTDGCEIVISELFLDYVSDKIVDSIEEGAKQQIKNIALLKLEKGKMVTNTGKVYTGNRKIYEATYYTIDGSKVTVKQGKNFGFQVDGKIVTTKGINQYHFFANNGMRVSIFRLLKHTSMILDVFSFFDWAKDPKSSLSIPFVPDAIVGIAIECVVQDIEEGISVAIENRLQVAKTEGIDAVRRFVNSWKPNSGIEFKLLKISTKTASDILHGKFKTLHEVELREYNEADAINWVYILVRIVDTPKSYAPEAIIETFFYLTD